MDSTVPLKSLQWCWQDSPPGTPGNLPIPVGIFMNMQHVPPRWPPPLLPSSSTSPIPSSTSCTPRFYNQHQQLLAAAEAASKAPPVKRAGRGARASQLSQGASQGESQGYSQGPFTQVG